MTAKVLSFSRQLMLFDDGYGSNITWLVIWVQWENEPNLTIYIYQRNFPVRVFAMTPQLNAQQFREYCKSPGMQQFAEGTSRAIVWLLSECRELAEAASNRTLAVNIKPIFSFLAQQRAGHWSEEAVVVNSDLTGPLRYLRKSFCEFGDFNIDFGCRCEFVEIWHSHRTGDQFLAFLCRNQGQALVILPDKSAVKLWLLPFGMVELENVDAWIAEYNPAWKSPDPHYSAFLWLRSYGLLMLEEKRLTELPLEVACFEKQHVIHSFSKTLVEDVQ